MSDLAPWSVDAMAAAMGAARAGPLPDIVAGLSIDSRSVAAGEAFFAIQGDTRDGHEFVPGALTAGAGLAVVSEAKRSVMPPGAPLLVVADVLRGLTDLAQASRARSRAKIIAVTGSVGINADGTYSSSLGDQTRRSLAIIRAAVEALGGRIEHVIRTRMFVTDVSRWEEVARVHGEVFAEIRPATSIVEVARLIDEAGKPIGLSPLFKAPLSFENALVQSIAGGNTMLFNEETRKLLATTRESSHIVSHDWWSYILVTGCGGEVCYDPESTLNYRQHSQNLIGSNISIRGRLQRLRRLLKGTFKKK